MGSVIHGRAQQRDVQLSSGNVSITEQGIGPVMILLHSNPGNTLDYAAVIPTLSEYYRVIAVDWPGYGISPPMRSSGRMGAPALLQVLTELIEQLSISSCILVGHSVGGSVAVQYALAHPQRVQALVLVCSGGFTPHNFFTRCFSRLQGSKWSLTPVTFARLYVRNRNAMSRQIIERAQNLHANPAIKQVTRDVWNSFLAADYDLSDKAHALAQPVLLVLGARDPVISHKRDGKVMQQSMPHAHVALLDTGHVPFAESPQTFLAQLQLFLDNL